jgi:hypothetical protein
MVGGRLLRLAAIQMDQLRYSSIKDFALVLVRYLG